MTATRMVAFHVPKAGSTETEWEDGAGFDQGDSRLSRPARCIVVDGATEAYDSIRWVEQLVQTFLGHDGSSGPEIDRSAIDAWFGEMQAQWFDQAPLKFGSIFEERKFQQEGSFATLLGCQIDDHESGPKWSAVALGDAVLFHVRSLSLIAQFPPMSSGDFGLNPEGVFTQPAQRARMKDALRFDGGSLQMGDTLYLATDAIGAWMVRAVEAAAPDTWRKLGAIADPRSFRSFVETERDAGRMKNDDVALLRVTICADFADSVLVSQP